MPDTISPVTREEDYLAAIAGQDVTPPTPVTRKEEWLDLIAGKVDDLAGDIEDLQEVVPTPAAADSGKVLTAGADGTASWADVPEELPASLGTAGQVLTVNAGATAVEWATPSGGGVTIIEMEWQAPSYETAILDILPETLYEGFISGARYLVHELQDEGTANEADVYYTICDLFRIDQEGNYDLFVTVANGAETPRSFETTSKSIKPSTGGPS